MSFQSSSTVTFLTVNYQWTIRYNLLNIYTGDSGFQGVEHPLTLGPIKPAGLEDQAPDLS